MKLTIYTDGASRGNPGPASYGFIILDQDGKLLYKEGKYIGITTNNVAEYTAVLQALKSSLEKFSQNNNLQMNKFFPLEREFPLEIELFSDSKLVKEQLSGKYKIKSPHLKPIIEKIQILALSLGGVTYNYIPRFQNARADKLANLALDSH